MTDFPATVSALATIVAALVGGAVTFLVAVFTKENKVSDFRQTWIDGLRDDTARFIGIWYYVAAELDLVDPEEFSSREFWRSVKDEFMEMEILQARIVLRLNPLEHGEVIERLEFLAQGESLTGLTHELRKAEIESFSTQIQNVLKSEWTRVKRGEDTYRAVKQVSKLVLAGAILILLAVAVMQLIAP